MNKTLVLLSALLAVSLANIQCGGRTCGNTGDLCCGQQCYNNASYDCINGVLCGKGNGVCKGNVCYDPNVATCYPGATSSQDVLCGKGLAACDSVCYDPTMYSCTYLITGSVIVQSSVPQTCGVYRCPEPYGCCVGRVSEFCFDSTKSSCVLDPNGSGKVSVCPFTASGAAQQGCQSDISSLPSCYDPSVNKCCHANGSPNGVITPINQSC